MTNEFKSFIKISIIKKINKTNLNLSEFSKDYLQNLIIDFLKSENIPEINKSELSFPILADLYEKAFYSPPFNQFNEFRNLGDVSLFVSGVFPEYITRRKSLVKKEYYIGMGSSAYLMTARLVKIKELENLFDELSKNFSSLVNILNLFSKETNVTKNFNI